MGFSDAELAVLTRASISQPHSSVSCQVVSGVEVEADPINRYFSSPFVQHQHLVAGFETARAAAEDKKR